MTTLKFIFMANNQKKAGLISYILMLEHFAIKIIANGSMIKEFRKKLVFKTIVATLYIILCLAPLKGYTQDVTLEQLFKMANDNSLTLERGRMSISFKEQMLKAQNAAFYPKVDFLSGYYYLSDPLEINVQTLKPGVVNGVTDLNLQIANDFYGEITGYPLPEPLANKVRDFSQSLTEKLYPKDNLRLSDQSYFLANAAVIMPIYMGGKLQRLKDVAKTELESSKTGLESSQYTLNYLITLHYLRVLSLNSQIQSSKKIKASLEKNLNYAESLVKNEILPPYQKGWASVALLDAESRISNFELSKKNTIVELNELMGLPLDTILVVNDTIRKLPFIIKNESESFWERHPAYHVVETAVSLAEINNKANKSGFLPDLFATGNYQFLQKNLPVVIPNWIIGINLKLQIFDGGETRKRVNASKLVLEESILVKNKTQEIIKSKVLIARNTIEKLSNDINSIQRAINQSQETTRSIIKRMENQLASPKDVTESVIIQDSLFKIYYAAVLAYDIAVADYLFNYGEMNEITKILN